MECINCECKLRKIDKFCSECGEITMAGEAVKALERMGEDKPDNPFVSIASSAPGWDPLNQGTNSSGWRMGDKEFLWEANYGDFDWNISSTVGSGDSDSNSEDGGVE